MNDLAFDGPAWWLHLSADVRGVDDRLGRVIASAFVFGPVTLLAYAASALLGLLDDAVLWLAVVLAALPCALGVAALVGAFIPGTAPRTGGNPFAARSGGAAQGCVTALISMVAPVLLLLPVGLFALLLRGAGDWRLVLPPVALGWGVGVCATGVVLGGLRLDQKGPEMLALLERAQV
jgi:ABC-2 type transport system permease protein